ncbi:hypothetical protein KC216_20745, partial [Mycobacterium tuberculosis]|nr:hypothetical protein [Mycobacterium tuberculosis]
MAVVPPDVWIIANFKETQLSDIRIGQPVTFTRQVGSLHRWYEGRAFKLEAERFGIIFLDVPARLAADARRAALLALGDRLRELASVSDMM